MKSRRLILTIECYTEFPLRDIRTALSHVALSNGRWILRYPEGHDGTFFLAIERDPAAEKCMRAHGTIGQVQVNVIGPAVKRKAKRGKGAK